MGTRGRAVVHLSDDNVRRGVRPYCRDPDVKKDIWAFKSFRPPLIRVGATLLSVSPEDIGHLRDGAGRPLELCRTCWNEAPIHGSTT